MKHSPKDFLKKRRPKKFSDSKIIKEGKLNRTVLEQHLSFLGARKQEKDFEEFARKLCQYEICPNLIPQTGSTGGGDSKVDTENTPVASQLQDFIYEGEDNQTKERLGFAFSTQKTWVTKVRSDIEKISKLDRKYSKVFFVTSEFTKDSIRAALEDELSKQYGFRVIIRDKNWILDKVFSNKRELIAIEELKMGEGLEEKKDIGPMDYQRKKRFEELNISIEKDVNENHITFQTVDDCLATALLAAELEEPKQTIQNLFDRAIRISDKYGLEEQYFTALYQKAWTTYFWLEDYPAFIDLYDQVESLALSSTNIFSVERLNNLWTLLSTLASESELVSENSLEQKANNLREKLKSLKDNKTNLSVSVQAESMLCHLNLIKHRDNPEELSKVFVEFKKIISKAKSLIGFPFETTFQIFNELDILFSGDEAFEALQDYLIEIVKEREGDISVASLLLNRGIQHLEAGRIYKSIDCLGRALMRFHKKESKDQLVRTLFHLSSAYENAGLLWASRGALLSAASHATSEFWMYGEINTMQLACYKRLKMIEIQLGRIGYAMEWHYLHTFFASQLAKSDEERGKLLDESIYFGSLMGLLVIKTPDEELKMLEKLPDVLIKMDLDYAAFGLMYRLGGESLLPSDFLIEKSSEEKDNFFNGWLTQPAQESLPDKPEYYVSEKVELKTVVLGCHYIVQTSNNSPEIEIGESILAALESFLATAIDMKAASIESTAVISISQDLSLGEEMHYEIGENVEFNISVVCGNFNPHSISPKGQRKISDIISEIVVNLLAHTIVFKDVKVDLKKLLQEEEVQSRAFSFSYSLISLGNVLGYKPKRAISDWLDSGDKTYSYSPDKSKKPIKIDRKTSNPAPEIPKKSEEPEFGPRRHNEINNISIIRNHLWEKAGWQGAAYITPPDNPPAMALMFESEDVAKAIFQDWQNAFGRQDKDEVIRISVIRGVSKKDPAWYRMLITNNLENSKHSIQDGQHLITTSRVHTLTPSSTENLDNFSKSFRKFGAYLLAPAIVEPGKTYPRLLPELGIVKRLFIERQAWEVGPNDIDMSGIRDETTPIIPDGIENAPVMDLIKKRKELKNKK